MKVTSSGIIDGVIQPQYGGRGTQFNENNIPTYSLPFVVEDAPSGTASIAIVLEDKDAYPVTGGFAWIHWLAANITRLRSRTTRARRPPTSSRAEIAGRASKAVNSRRNCPPIMAE